MSIIVIGRRSYLGGILSKYLAEHEFTQSVSLAEFVQMPIRGTDVIINCAFSPAWYLGDLPEDLGFDGTAAAIVQRAGARYVMISSRAVYQTRLDPPLREAEPVAPSTVYGRNKAKIESGLSKMLGERLMILRPANVFGAEPAGRRTFVSTAFGSLTRTNTIELDIAARTRKDFVPAWFVGKAAATLIERRSRGIFNIGSGTALEIGRIANALISGYGQGQLHQTGERVGEEFRLDIAKLHEQTGLSLAADAVLLEMEAVGRACKNQSGAR
jgi:nucleoside-diphosphate-sugar epimerase